MCCRACGIALRPRRPVGRALPAHDNHVSSFSIAIGTRRQRIVWRCFLKPEPCSPQAIRSALITVGVPPGCLGSFGRARQPEARSSDQAAFDDPGLPETLTLILVADLH